MSIYKKLRKEAAYFYNYVIKYTLLKIVSDEMFLKYKWRKKKHYKLNLDSPQTFNEKLQWLKLYDRNPLYTTMVDKSKAKEYVKTKVPELDIIPTLGIWDRFEDINFEELPEQFVLKCTHDSGSVVLCNNKETFDKKYASHSLNRALKRNYYWHQREYVYKNVKPRIVAEKYMGNNINDYKVFCFNGEPKYIQVDYDRFIEHKRNIYTTDWKVADAKLCYPNDKSRMIKRPENLEEMLQYASILSQGISFLRVDFYSIDNNLFFGELTFYPEAAMGTFDPPSFDYELGSYIDLSLVKNKY